MTALRLRAEYLGGRGSRTVIDETNPEKDPMQFTREADHFSECVLENKTPKSSGEEGLRDMQYIEQIYAAAGAQSIGGSADRHCFGKAGSWGRQQKRIRTAEATQGY